MSARGREDARRAGTDAGSASAAGARGRSAAVPAAAPRSATVRGRLRSRLPRWSILVLAALFLGPIVAHEPIFGDGSGAIAAGAGVAAGLGIAAAASKRRWDPLSVLAAVLAAHFALGGAAALRPTTLHGLPTARTLQMLVLGAVESWKDLLTLAPPASAYLGPALVPWMTGLVCATLAGITTLRWGRALLGTAPILLMGVVGVAFGPAGTRPALAPVLAWWAAVLAWWGFAALRRRIDAGEDVVVGRAGAATSSTSATSGASRAAVRLGRRLVSALLMIALGIGVAGPLAQSYGPWNSRIVGRDLVDPPLDAREYPSPLAAYRHYSTDLEEETLLSVVGLPEGARIRIAAMDVYDGTTFAMSRAGAHEDNGYLSVGADLPERAPVDGAKDATLEISTERLLGPWVPVAGSPRAIRFEGEGADALQDGLHADLWADAALTTGPQGPMTYAVETSIAPQWSEGQLEGVEAVRFSGRDDSVPAGVADLAASVSAKAGTPLGRARAIERYLSEEGFYSNEDSASSRPGHRADRLARMIAADQLIGDDEQYAALMALMLHSLGMNARVVMGLYSDGATTELRGSDVHAWVEVEFARVGWAVFDPTPPHDQTPQTEVTKPRSVPRPQVLQPPEPPEEPVELSPSNSDRAADSKDEPGEPLPWGVIVGASSAVLLLVGPVVLVLALKARRRRRRRRAEPGRRLVGSWDELVDMATDAGMPVAANRTRQEAAWELAETWPGAASPREDGPAIPGWTLFAEEVPTTVAVARRADVADFSAEGGDPAEADAAWRDVDALAARLRAGTGLIGRIRRALSLKSLRRGRAGRRTGIMRRVLEAMRRRR